MKARHDSSNIGLSQTQMDFGRHAICEYMPDQEVVLTNTGTVQETVTPALANGGAGFTTSFVSPATIQPGRQYRMVFHFNKTTYGAFNDTLILTTQLCDKVYRIPIHAELDKQEYVVTPSPLAFPNTSISGTLTRQLHIQNNGGFDGNIYKIDIEPAGDFTLPTGFQSNVPTGNAIDVNVRFSPKSEGVSSAEICVIFAAPCPDTICVAVTGTGVQGALGLHPNALNYGTMAQCEKKELSDTLINTGTGPITLLTAQVTGPDSGAFTITTPLTTPEVLASNGQRIFKVAYDASLIATDGPVSASLTISTDNVALPIVDVPLDGVRNTFTISPGGTIACGLIEINVPNSQTITLRNTGSAELCYAHASLPAGVTVTPAFPFCIDAGKTLDITVTVTLGATGSWNGQVALYTDAPCSDSTMIQASASVQQGALTQSSSYDFGAVAYCLTPQTTFDIRNTYLADARLDSISMTGNAQYFAIGSPAGIPGSNHGRRNADDTAFLQSRSSEQDVFADIDIPSDPVWKAGSSDDDNNGIVVCSGHDGNVVAVSVDGEGNDGGREDDHGEERFDQPIHVAVIAPSSTDFVINGTVHRCRRRFRRTTRLWWRWTLRRRRGRRTRTVSW